MNKSELIEALATKAELSKAAADCGADGLLLVSPYYNKPTQDMQRRHFLEVAEATTLPIMLYNIPGRTAVEIFPETLAKLAEHPRIVAVKQSLPDLDPVSDLAARLADASSPSRLSCSSAAAKPSNTAGLSSRTRTDDTTPSRPNDCRT